MSNKKSFNLTEKGEYDKALTWLNVFFALNPGLFLIRGMINFFRSSVPDTNQVDAAIKLIEAGKKNGLKRMRIKVSKKAGMKLKVNSILDGLGVSTKLKGKEEMIVKIEYK
ncbi:hypothetical protein [Kordia sp.]|uniref:hypothetical protein n=1 Tax=Kordia sp. TaxID=1965332 RepID=UPI003D2D9975